MIRTGIVLYCIYALLASFAAHLLSKYPEDYVRNSIAFVVNFILIPFTLCHIAIEERDLKIINKSFIFMGILVGLYGVVNYILKINPYALMMSMYSNTEDTTSVFLEEERGLLQGRVSSFFIHPLQLGQVSVVMFTYGLFAFKNEVNKLLKYLYLGLMALMCFLCGSRSAIVPIVLVCFFYLIYNSSSKSFFRIVIVIFLLFASFVFVPSDSLDSIKGFLFVWNDSYASDAGIKGSSFAMRLQQLSDALDVASDNPLLGLGQGYVSQHGHDHLEMKGYEGYLLQFLVDGGILGTLMFTFFYLFLYVVSLKKTYMKDKLGIHLFFISYFVNILFTGIQQGTFTVFVIFLFCFLGIIQVERRNGFPDPCKA